MTFNSNLVASVKVDGKIMREHSDKIYLPFGSEYSILLKNLNTVKAQINIFIDGEDILDGNSLILNANSDMDLERWLVGGLQSGPALKFIEKTDTIRETKEETGMDGVVEIRYQFEKIYTTTHWEYNTWNIPHDQIFYSSPDRGFSVGNNSSSNSSIGGGISSSIDAILMEKDKGPIHFNAQENMYCCADLNDEGMTIKGHENKQKFDYGTIGILDGVNHSITFQLKGDVNQEKVVKPITVKTKVKCDACGKMNKSTYKFCTSCGNNLKYSK